MKQSLGFIKTTALGGLVVIVPLAILLFVTAQILYIAIDMISQVAEWLPFAFLDNPVVISLLAIAVIIAICFFTGLAVRTATGANLQQRFDRFLERKIPLYGVVRSITQRFAGIEDEQLTPAEIDLYGSGSGLLGFIMERLPDGRFCVFVPDVPLLTVGRMFVVTEAQVRRLPGSMHTIAEAVTQWGVGLNAVYSGNEEAPPETDAPREQDS